MTTQTVAEGSIYEQALFSIIRTLPVEQVQQILEFARFIQTQTLEDFALVDEETIEEIAADEALWDAQFAETQDELHRMADVVRAQIKAGQVKPMVFTKDGKIAPG
jgi:hypothetical protein